METNEREFRDFVKKILQEERGSYDSDIYAEIETRLKNLGTVTDSDIQQIATDYNSSPEEVKDTLNYILDIEREKKEAIPASTEEIDSVNDLFNFIENKPQSKSIASVEYVSTLNSYLSKPKNNPMAGKFIKLTRYEFRWGDTYKRAVERTNPNWELQTRKGNYTKPDVGLGVLEMDARGDEVLPIVPINTKSIVLVLDDQGGVIEKISTKEIKEKYAQFFQPSFFSNFKASGSGTQFRPLKVFAINKVAAGGNLWVNPPDKFKPEFEKYREYFGDL